MENKILGNNVSLTKYEKALAVFLVYFYIAVALFIIIMLPIAVCVQLVRWVM